MRVAVLALDLAAAPPGRGDEAWTPPAGAHGPAHADAASAVAALARALGHEVEVLRLTYPTLDRLDDLRCDVAVDLCEGLGRDGFPGVEVVEALAARGLPCAGADRGFLLLGLDKALARARLARRGVPIPRGVVLDDAAPLDALDALRPPLVVKPREGGGSVGVAVAADLPDARGAAAAARATYGGVVVEELVAGPELSVPVLAGRVLPAVEVAFAPEVPALARVLAFADKHAPPGTWWLEAPPRVAPDLVRRAEAVARAAYDALGGVGHGRVDLRLGPDGPVVLEVNPNPSLEPALRREEQGLYARSLAAAGVSRVEWLRVLLDDALARHASGSARSRRDPRGREA
ncbi:MAG: hypothetical protein M9894_18465 [Planctomycetes bacterium]|nr:hypothetical protein [Planctomycetota bacterium]